MEDKLATQLLKELKTQFKRLFVAFVIVMAMLFLSNLAWLYAWNLPGTETKTEVVQDGTGTNNFIGNDGDITNGTGN